MAAVHFEELVAALQGAVDSETKVLAIREGERVEYKESFNWAGRSTYAKSMAAFANHSGGFLVFGVRNDNREIAGLKSTNFESQDDAKMAQYLNGLFAPALGFERAVVEIVGLKIGLLWTAPHEQTPVMALKSDGDIKEAEIYYRYNASSEKIKFPEMKRVLDRVRDREAASWTDLLSRVARIGPNAMGIMDIAGGEIYGRSGSLLIDADLVPKLNFIKEGAFQDGGAPTLKLVGDVTPVERKPTPTAVRLTDDPDAPAMREEDIRESYPLDYNTIIKRARKRYSDFSANIKFIGVMKNAKKNPSLAYVRYLHPDRRRHARATSTVRYSANIFDELDKHYKLKP